MNSSFVFYESFRAATKGLDDSIRLNIYDAIMDYALYGVEPELEGVAMCMFILIRPQVDANKKRREDGQKGGRPQIKESDKTDGFEDEKPVVIETENHGFEDEKPNVNVNVNVNANVNENVNVKDNPPIIPPRGWGDVSPELLSVLTDFEKMRKKMRKPLTDRAKQLNLAKLRKLAPDEKTQIAIVERSIERSWQGFYALEQEEGQQECTSSPQEKFLTLEDIYGQRGAERFRRSYARPEGGSAGL